MAKISAQKKVELLEAAVLSNDTDEVKTLYSEYGEFEFTARALGLAMRFCGSRMVGALLENGASLDYQMTPALKRKYDCRISINNFDDLKINYVWYIFPAYEVKGYEKDIVSDSERVLSLQMLYEKVPNAFQEILYYAVLFDDQIIYDAVRELGICKLSGYRTMIAAGQEPYNRLDSYGRYDRNEFTAYVIGRKASEEATVRKLRRFLECMDVEKITFFPSDFYETDWNSPMLNGTVFVKKYCSEIMFDFFIKNTNMIDKVKKWDLLFALVDENNASGLQYGLEEKWISKPKDIDSLLAYAKEKQDAKPELIGYILEKQNKAAPAKSKKKSVDSELSLDKKPLSVAEMKKIWGYKKQEDGTLIITSYKGEDTEVVIPASIGKDTVTAIDPDTFSTTAARITVIQKKVRKAIVSVEFPGTIKSIPSHIFYDGYTGYYNNSDSPHAILKRVIINEGTEVISKSAFEDCKGLEEIVIPETVTEIGDGAFRRCWALASISLPQSITTLSNYMFAGCGFERFDIPERITTFGRGVFYDCEKLKSVHMSDEVTEISDSMFERCKELKSFDFPKSISKIGENAFLNCPFEEVIIPETVTQIGSRAFAYCSELKKIHVPEDTQLRDGVFLNCQGLVNESGQIVVNGILFGLQDSAGGWRLSASAAVKPLEVKSDIKSVAINRDQLPEIVYREHSEEGATIDVNGLSVGDEVAFGRFPETEDYIMHPLKWRVIAKENGKALLITVQNIISQSDEMKQTGVWSDCPVRKLLNEGFYRVAFTDVEREQIVLSTLENPKNKDVRVDGGPPTEDHVFLLSIDEVEKYMPTEESRKSTATEYAHKQHPTRRDWGFWQLRTPGKDWGSVAVSEETGGYSAMTGNHVGYSYLRPAIWVK